MTLTDIEKDIKNASKRWRRQIWLFPKDKVLGVNGFKGTDKIFIVGPCPGAINPIVKSKKKKKIKVSKDFLNPFCLALYYRLKENKLQNAHITDFIKIGGIFNKVWKLKIQILAENIKFFIDEIDAINPRLILFCGETQFKQLFEIKRNKQHKKLIKVLKQINNIDIKINAGEIKINKKSIKYWIIPHFSARHIGDWIDFKEKIEKASKFI
jgi:hypothetical protein